MKKTVEERKKQRQDEIITAVRRCFIVKGFHATSMSQIAAETQLSVGQIYRYFSNKNAIIEEIIRRIIDQRIAEMDEKMQTQMMPKILAWRQTLSSEDDALLLEMSAEASRNEQVAAMFAEADRRMFDKASSLLASQYPSLSETRRRCIVEVMAVMMEGSIYRRLTPQKVASPDLEIVYQRIIDNLLQPD